MDKYGLIGYPLTHSFSRDYFNEKFENEGIDATYINYEILSVEELPEIVHTTLELRGLNVTIPYKKAVVSCCGELSKAAERLQSVNTLVHRPDGTLYGDNTDLFGFLYMVRRIWTATPMPRSSSTPPRWGCIPITARRRWICGCSLNVKACWTSFITRRSPRCCCRRRN